MKTFKDYLEEEAPINTSSGPGVNMNPTGRPVKPYRKLDRRSRFDTYKMYRRSLGLKNTPQAIRNGEQEEEED